MVIVLVGDMWASRMTWTSSSIVWRLAKVWVWVVLEQLIQSVLLAWYEPVLISVTRAEAHSWTSSLYVSLTNLVIMPVSQTECKFQWVEPSHVAGMSFPPTS